MLAENHIHTLRASQMATVMRASGCGAGDVASYPATETCIGLDSPQQSFLPLQPATYSRFIRRAERMTLQRERERLTPLSLFISFFHAQRNQEEREGGEIFVF